jgi:hypothetical protein
MMTHYVGMDVLQRTTATCVVDEADRRIWRGMCPTSPEAIERAVRPRVIPSASSHKAIPLQDVDAR